MPVDAVDGHSHGRTVVVLGASNKPERYAFLAVQRLQAAAIRVIPVNPAIAVILSIPVVKTLADIHEPVHTISVYLNAAVTATMADAIIALKPQRVIFNPGAESAFLSSALAVQGIEVLNACTLVLIATGRLFSP